MANIKLSTDYINNGYSQVENAFISDYMPNLEDNSIKVYLYSLYLASSRRDKQNPLDAMSVALNMEISEINRAVDELKDNNLIRMLSATPLEYEIIPIRQDAVKTKKYKTDKYCDFTRQLQEIFLDRMLFPNDYIKYYELIEEYKISPEALIMIACYCIRLKTTKVNHNYILTVAKAWALEGAVTVNDIENKLQEIESSSDSIRQIFYALNLKSTPDMEDKQLFMKWTKSWGYTFEAILATSKLCKKRGGMTKLDSMLDQFYKLGIFTLKDIEEHANYIGHTRDLAIAVNKKLGLYYDSVDNIVETYTSEWLNKGFADDAITAIAGYCFKRSIRNLDGMNAVMDKFYKEGLITLSAINQHIDQSIDTDKVIKDLLTSCGALRSVKESDRNMYRVWTIDWGFSGDIIAYACSLALGKSQAFAYVNQLLANWKDAKLTTLDACKKTAVALTRTNSPSSKSAHFEGERDYSNEELNSIFGDITNIDNIDF